MYAGYDEVEIGALDCDEIEGYIAHDSDLVLQCAEEFEKKQKEDVSVTQCTMREKCIVFLHICRQKILQNL